MPIEIKELNIKINVSDREDVAQTEHPFADFDTYNNLVKDCVEQVLEVIANKHER